MPDIGPYSRPSVLAKLDGRTREAKCLRELRAALVAHVGGSPSATQSALIDQAAWLGLHIDLMNRRTAEGRAMTERDSREYLAWVNSQGRLLRQLGLRGTPAPKRSLAEHMAGAGAAA
jgi:hypothetical protein